jgi:hypothetical protein
MSLRFGAHVNRFRVRPRVCKTDRVQIPIAADSFAFDVCLLLRVRTVLRTFLIQRQNLAARDCLRVLPFIYILSYSISPIISFYFPYTEKTPGWKLIV